MWRTQPTKENLVKLLEEMYKILTSRFLGPDAEFCVSVMYDLVLARHAEASTFYRIFRGFRPDPALWASGAEEVEGHDVTECPTKLIFRIQNISDVSGLAGQVMTELATGDYMNDQNYEESM